MYVQYMRTFLFRPFSSPVSFLSSVCAGTASISATSLKNYYVLDLSAYLIGGTLVAQTCGVSTVDTLIFVGTGCFNNATAYGCVAGNDDSCSVQSSVTITGTTTNKYYIMVAPYSGTSVVSGFAWTYTPPTPSQTSTPSQTATPSNTATVSAGASISNTASISVSASPTRTLTATPTSTLSITPTITDTPSAGYTASPTQTPSPSQNCQPRSPNYKGLLAPVNGVFNGSVFYTMTASDSTTPYQTTSYYSICSNGLYMYFNRPKHVFEIDLTGQVLGESRVLVYVFVLLRCGHPCQEQNIRVQ